MYSVPPSIYRCEARLEEARLALAEHQSQRAVLTKRLAQRDDEV